MFLILEYLVQNFFQLIGGVVVAVVSGIILYWLIPQGKNHHSSIKAGGSIQAGGDIIVGGKKIEKKVINNFQSIQGEITTERIKNGITTRKEYDPVTETSRVVSVQLSD